MHRWLEEDDWENKGGYFLTSKDGEITFSETCPDNRVVIDKNYVVDMYFKVGMDILKHFSESGANKDVYAVCFGINSQSMSPEMYINTVSGLAERNAYYKKYYTDKNIPYDKNKERTTTYSTGDFAYIYDGFSSYDYEFPEEVEWFSDVCSFISDDSPAPSPFPHDVAIKNELFCEHTVDIGLRVAARLEEASAFLDKTEDCIFFHCDHDEDFFYNKDYEAKYKAIYPWLFE